MSTDFLSESLPPVPQVGRTPQNHARDEEPRGLWSQLLTAFRDLSGSFDPFANDANPQVRALGRAAHSRATPLAADYYQIGDLCARLTLQGTLLSQTYAAKTIAAYHRVGEVAAEERVIARQAMLAFTAWAADTARLLGRSEALQVALLTCELVSRLGHESTTAEAMAWLAATESVLREEIDRVLAGGEPSNANRSSEYESRQISDQAQMLLRQGQPEPALHLLERALLASERNHAAWLWRAMALTDLGRFNEAISSYDRALDLEPENAGVWNNKGALLMELGRLESALACFERALELSLATATVQAIYWLNKGKTLYMLARYPDARTALTTAHDLDPSPESAAGLAACQERLNSAPELPV
jgi:tetratricopeptide (TPR) repeat protein